MKLSIKNQSNSYAKSVGVVVILESPHTSFK